MSLGGWRGPLFAGCEPSVGVLSEVTAAAKEQPDNLCFADELCSGINLRWNTVESSPMASATAFGSCSPQSTPTIEAGVIGPSTRAAAIAAPCRSRFR